MTNCFPDNVITDRRVLLSYQHRMHPEIAQFSHQHIYHEEALITPENIISSRTWDYQKYSHRSLWIDAKGKRKEKNANKDESSKIIKHLEDFNIWVSHQSNNGKPWDVGFSPKESALNSV